MKIYDSHCDILTKLKENEELYQNNNDFNVKEFIKVGGKLQFAAIQLPKQLRYIGGAKFVIEKAMLLYNEIKKMQDKNIIVNVVKNRKDINKVDSSDISFLLSIEDGGAIEESLEVLEAFYYLGIRAIGLTWSYRNAISDGINEEVSKSGLTFFGKKVVKKMSELGMIIDVSHISEKGFWDVVENTKTPILASHSNAKAICNSKRNLDDKQIKMIAETKGCIGVCFYPKFLNNDYEKAGIEDVIKHIDYILELVGDDYICFGGDFDGMDIKAKGLKNVKGYRGIITEMKKRYSQETIEKILNKNLERVIETILN